MRSSTRFFKCFVHKSQVLKSVDWNQGANTFRTFCLSFSANSPIGGTCPHHLKPTQITRTPGSEGNCCAKFPVVPCRDSQWLPHPAATRRLDGGRSPSRRSRIGRWRDQPIRATLNETLMHHAEPIKCVTYQEPNLCDSPIKI